MRFTDFILGFPILDRDMIRITSPVMRQGRYYDDQMLEFVYYDVEEIKFYPATREWSLKLSLEAFSNEN